MLDSVLAKNMDVFSFPVACITPSDTMKGSQWEGDFHVSSGLISLCPADKAHCVFSNKILLLSYDGQPRAMAITCDILGAPGNSLNNNS